MEETPQLFLFFWVTSHFKFISSSIDLLIDWLLKAALKIVQPSAKREGFATVPGVSWADVGALADIREELQLSILAPVRSEKETWKHYLFFAHIL